MCGYSSADIEGVGGGDCDDTDPLSNSLGVEIWDGVDRNCDEIVDKLNIFDAYKSYFATALSDDGYLGSGLAALGDYNGDGFSEIAISSPFGLTDPQTGASQGKVYILSLGGCGWHTFRYGLCYN